MTSTTIQSPSTSTNFVASLHADFEALWNLGEHEFQGGLTDLLLTLTASEYENLRTGFGCFAHSPQLPPLKAANGDDWTT